MKSEDRFHRILSDRLLEIAREIGYQSNSLAYPLTSLAQSNVPPTDSDEFRLLESRWTAYLEKIGIKRKILPPLTRHGWEPDLSQVYRAEYRENGILVISDPLYVTGGNMEVPEETYVRILTLDYAPQ